MKHHCYQISVAWTGNTGHGTSSYTSYKRDHEISGPGKFAAVACSSDPSFRGDVSRYNPEELLVASLAACHMLWVLHLCSTAGIVVTSYQDAASGTMAENAGGSGHFTEVTLHPVLTITDESRIGETVALHHKAHEMCFIANSVNFPVQCEPAVTANHEPRISR